MWGVAVWPCRPACCHAYESGVCCWWPWEWVLYSYIKMCICIFRVHI